LTVQCWIVTAPFVETFSRNLREETGSNAFAFIKRESNEHSSRVQVDFTPQQSGIVKSGMVAQTLFNTDTFLGDIANTE